MKKKVVYLSYDFMGYEEEVIKLLEDVMGFGVYFINALKYEYKYKNIVEKFLNNIYYKLFCKKYLKDVKFDKMIIEKIEEIGEVDYYFSIRADKFSHKIFRYIKNKNKPMFLHHWDSFSFIEKQKEFLSVFDGGCRSDCFNCSGVFDRPFGAIGAFGPFRKLGGAACGRTEN